MEDQFYELTYQGDGLFRNNFPDDVKSIDLYNLQIHFYYLD